MEHEDRYSKSAKGNCHGKSIYDATKEDYCTHKYRNKMCNKWISYHDTPESIKSRDPPKAHGSFFETMHSSSKTKRKLNDDANNFAFNGNTDTFQLDESFVDLPGKSHKKKKHLDDRRLGDKYPKLDHAFDLIGFEDDALFAKRGHSKQDGDKRTAQKPHASQRRDANVFKLAEDDPFGGDGIIRPHSNPKNFTMNLPKSRPIDSTGQTRRDDDEMQLQLMATERQHRHSNSKGFTMDFPKSRPIDSTGGQIRNDGRMQLMTNDRQPRQDQVRMNNDDPNYVWNSSRFEIMAHSRYGDEVQPPTTSQEKRYNSLVRVDNVGDTRTHRMMSDFGDAIGSLQSLIPHSALRGNQTNCDDENATRPIIRPIINIQFKNLYVVKDPPRK